MQMSSLSFIESRDGGAKRLKTDTITTYAVSCDVVCSSGDSDEVEEIVKTTTVLREITNEEKRSEDTELATSSRYARSGTKGMFSGLSDDVCKRLQSRVYQRLLDNKTLVYPKGLNKAMVTTHPCLSRFTCWSASGTGIKIHTSGGKFNQAQNLQVGYPSQTIGGTHVDCKNMKWQAHKLSLVVKLDILYQRLEETGHESSHLCHSTTGCWRPEHLCAESHKDNLARNSNFGCAGWFWFIDKQALICYCSHTPRCEFVRIMPQQQGFEQSA